MTTWHGFSTTQYVVEATLWNLAHSAEAFTLKPIIPLLSVFALVAALLMLRLWFFSPSLKTIRSLTSSLSARQLISVGITLMSAWLSGLALAQKRPFSWFMRSSPKSSDATSRTLSASTLALLSECAHPSTPPSTPKG
jgi:hypothetical protein